MTAWRSCPATGKETFYSVEFCLIPPAEHGSRSHAHARKRATKLSQERKGKKKVFQLLKGEHTDSSVSVRLPSTRSLSASVSLLFEVWLFLYSALSPLGKLHPGLRFLTFKATPVVAAKFPSVRQTARQLRHLRTQQQQGQPSG